MDRTFHTKPTIIASLIGFGTMFFGMCVIAVILERLEGKDPTKLGLVLLTWFVFFPMWLASIYAFFQMVRSIRVDDLGISVTGPKYCFQKTWNEVIRRDIIGSGQDGYILYFRRGLNLELNSRQLEMGLRYANSSTQNLSIFNLNRLRTTGTNIVSSCLP